MVLTAPEQALIATLRKLGPNGAEPIFRWAKQLEELAGGEAIDWADGWSAEDCAEATRAALIRLEEREAT